MGKGVSTLTSTGSNMSCLIRPRITASLTPPIIASSRISPCRSPIRSSACARCSVIRSGIAPVARYSMTVRAPSNADMDDSAIRNTAAGGLR